MKFSLFIRILWVTRYCILYWFGLCDITMRLTIGLQEVPSELIGLRDILYSIGLAYIILQKIISASPLAYEKFQASIHGLREIVTNAYHVALARN